MRVESEWTGILANFSLHLQAKNLESSVFLFNFADEDLLLMNKEPKFKYQKQIDELLANGLKTDAANNGHFDFYEYESCNLNKTFQMTKHLI